MGFRKRITLDTTTLGGSQFDVDVIINQAYLIITGMSTFILVGEFRMDAKRCFRFFVGKSDRHERDVIQISRSSAGKMCVAETGNRTVRIEITGDTVPSGESVVRAKLHHAERSLGTRISVSSEVCSDKWIYIRCVIYFVFFLRRGTRNEHAG